MDAVTDRLDQLAEGLVRLTGDVQKLTCTVQDSAVHIAVLAQVVIIHNRQIKDLQNRPTQ